MGFLDKIGFTKLKEGLTKTREGIVGKVTRLITARSKIDDVTLEEVEEILIGADVGVDASTAIIDAIRKRVKEERYADTSELNNLLRDEIQKQFANGSSDADPFQLPSVKPLIPTTKITNGFTDGSWNGSASEDPFANCF